MLAKTEKTKTEPVIQNSQATESERMKGLKAIQGVLKLDKKLTMEDIRKKRLDYTKWHQKYFVQDESVDSFLQKAYAAWNLAVQDKHFDKIDT